jgi:hypothetical protein
VARVDRRLLGQLFGQQPLTVIDGPFKGLKYLRFSNGSALLPKLLGSYEKELHPALDEIVRGDYRRIVNIGCAEGYYAVGLALKLPQAEICAFEIDLAAQDRCRQLAELNGVFGRLKLQGACTVQALRPLADPRTLIVCDCEGAEMDLLDPEKVPGLLQTDLLVELHDFIDPRISETLFRRFKSSHRIRTIASTDRTPAAYPILASLQPKDQSLALEEFRPGPMEWAFMQSQ